MTSQRPYLLRALYEWIVDNGMTPYVLVDATRPGVRVPAHAVQDGRIVLNIAERAVAHLQMEDDALRFTARFGGVSQAVVVPVAAVVAIYARETGQGMALPEDPRVPPVDVDPEPAPEPEGLGALRADYGTEDTDADSGPGDDDRPPPRRGHLRVVK
nr:ClpXP protease specificity-enhancing factor [Thermomonas flagellata]